MACLQDFSNISQLSKYCIWGRVMYKRMRLWTVLNWVITDSGNGLSPLRRQAITWINDDLLSIGPFGNKLLLTHCPLEDLKEILLK